MTATSMYGAAAPGASTPTNDKADGEVGRVGEQESSESPDCQAASRADQPETTDEKRFATLRALLALKGFALRRTDGPTYIVSRWNLNRELKDIADLHAFAKAVGVRA